MTFKYNIEYKRFILFSSLIVFGIFYSCRIGDHNELEIITISDEEAERDADLIRNGISETVSENSLALWGGQSRPGTVSPDLREGFKLSLWASEKLLSDPTALHIDNNGRAWVTVTKRSKSSEPDIRQHPEWMIESISLENVEERRDFLYRKLSTDGKYDRNDTYLSDINGDGKIDWRDLTVEKEEIWRIEDLTGNGFANQAQLFIRNFNEEITEAAGTVLYHDGDVFLGLAPDLWRIRDTNGDGMADWKESISHGYCVNIGFCGHLLSGLTVGPAGRIYWNAADSGFSVVDKEGKRWHYPRQGAILRSETDGSNFEVYSTGVRNTYEFQFDKHGNLITVDNDGDWPDEYERLVYLIDGSDSGWRTNWEFGKFVDPKNNNYRPWGNEQYYKPRFKDQAAHILPPLAPFSVGPAGMAYNPGTALNEEWNDNYFIMSFPGSPTRGAISALSLKTKGASFELDKNEVVVEGLLAVSLDFGPDGALYFNDWVDGWFTNGLGRIWKLDTNDNVTNQQIRRHTRELLQENFDAIPNKELVKILEHDDMRVRQKAQFELAKRDDITSLLSIIENSSHQLARIHGIWGLAQIGRRNSNAVKPLIRFLEDNDPEIRAQAARWLGDVRYKSAAESILPLLKDKNSRVRFFATEALGRIGDKSAIGPIVEMLETNNDEDVYLRHSGAIALERIGDATAVTALSNHPSRAVRIAAVVTLKRMENSGAANFLADEDEYIVTNAARAINDDAFILDALPELGAMLDQNKFVNEPLMRRAINASLYLGRPEDAMRLAEFALREDVKSILKVEALNALKVWTSSSTLDRVTGDPRGRVENDPNYAHRALELVVQKLSGLTSSSVRRTVIEVIATLNYQIAIPELLVLFNEDPSPDVRITILNTLHKLEYEMIDDFITQALEDPDLNVRGSALELIPELEISKASKIALLKMALDTGEIKEKQLAMGILSTMQGEEIESVLLQYLEDLSNGLLSAELKLELFEALEEVGGERLRNELQKYRDSKNNENLLANYEETLYGGNADMGKQIFFDNTNAQCIRCHTLDGSGTGGAGPDLMNLAKNLNREEILQELIDPNARIAPGYGNVSVTLLNGKKIRGMLQKENNEELVISNGEQSWSIKKSNLKDRVNSPSSMPAMGNILSRSQIRDLVEYLATLED